jgi:hypothetical protein
LVTADIDVDPAELVVGTVPVIDAELALARARVAGTCYQRRQAAAKLLRGCLLRVDRRRNALLPQEKT